MKNRLDNFALNLSSSGIKFVLSTLIGFILTPIVIKGVGAEAFGLFKTIQDYVSYLMLLEFGLFGALLSVFNRLISEKNESEEKQALYFGIKSYAVIALISIVGGLCLTPLLTQFIKSDQVENTSLYFSYILLLLTFLPLPFSIFKAHLDASQKSYHINTALIIQNIINALMTILALQMDWGLPGLCFALLSAVIISSFYFYLNSNIKFKEIFKYKKLYQKNIELQQSIKRIRKATFISNLAGKVCLFTDNIVIGYILGAKFVTPFFVTQKLSQIIQTQLQSLSHSSWAGLGEIYHQDSPEALGYAISDLTKWIAVLGVTTLVPLTTYNQSFIHLWTGASTYAGNSVTIVACLNAFFLAIISLWGWSFTATSKVDLLVPLNWTQAVVNFGLNILLTYKFGLVGPILATLITYVFIHIIWTTYLMKREFRTSLLKLNLNWFLPLAYGCLFAYLWNYFRGDVLDIGWIQIILEMSIQGLIILFFAFYLVMSKRERKASYKRLKKLIRR